MIGKISFGGDADSVDRNPAIAQREALARNVSRPKAAAFDTRKSPMKNLLCKLLGHSPKVDSRWVERLPALGSDCVAVTVHESAVRCARCGKPL